jgi:hypothetical protein
MFALLAVESDNRWLLGLWGRRFKKKWRKILLLRKKDLREWIEYSSAQIENSKDSNFFHPK